MHLILRMEKEVDGAALLDGFDFQEKVRRNPQIGLGNVPNRVRSASPPNQIISFGRDSPANCESPRKLKFASHTKTQTTKHINAEYTNAMPREMTAELEDDDISWGDLEESYSLHLERGYSCCSSISAGSAFASLYDEIIEEWIDDDGNVYLVEECEVSELHHDKEDENVGQPSHEEETLEIEIVSLDSKDLEYPNKEYPILEESSGEMKQSREANKQSKRRKSFKKMPSRPAFLRSLSTLSKIESFGFRKKPKQIMNAAA